MFRLYKITLRQDGSENAQRDDYTDVTTAEGAFEVQKGMAMESGTFTFLMLLDNIGKIHKNSEDTYIAKIGEGTLKPRLYEVKTTSTEGEVAKSYVHEDANGVSADYYQRLGGAKQNDKVIAEMLRGIDADGSQLEYTYWVRPIEPSAEQSPNN